MFRYGTLGLIFFIRFYPADVENVRNPVEDLSYGWVVKATIDTVEVIVRDRMTSAPIQDFLLQPLHPDSFLTTAISCMVMVIEVEQQRIMPQ